MTSHPLLNKVVCRKCPDECESCYDNLNCIKCKNYLSIRTNQCVAQCSIDEYLDNKTQVSNCCSLYGIEIIFLLLKQCLPCHAECLNGCLGSTNFECNDCKTFKLLLNDEIKTKNKIKSITFNQTIGNGQKTTSDVASLVLLNDKNQLCLDRCPNEFPYISDDLLCINIKLSQSLISKK